MPKYETVEVDGVLGVDYGRDTILYTLLKHPHTLVLKNPKWNNTSKTEQDAGVEEVPAVQALENEGGLPNQ